ncbi:MAG: hypothetical protein KJO07_23545 [Deltaproteobacteria bacterium]|nr:hypothetical protein [Deltaproteobacteria bacterium]
MTPEEAADLLADDDLIPIVSGALSYAKQLRDQCLQAGVPVVLGDQPGKS